MDSHLTGPGPARCLLHEPCLADRQVLLNAKQELHRGDASAAASDELPEVSEQVRKVERQSGSRSRVHVC